MYNVSVKFKRRCSVDRKKRMSLYLQLIYRREVRKIPLPYRVSEKEWDETRGEVRIPAETSSGRAEELYRMQQLLSRDNNTACSVAHRMERQGDFSIEDIASVCRERFHVSTLKAYTEHLIARLILQEQLETARHYRSTLNSFMDFRKGYDLYLDELDATLLKEFETCLREKGLSNNTISFYFRTLRAVWNHAVREGIVKGMPGLFDNVHTRVEKTRKLAIEEKVILELVALELLSPGLSFARDLFLFCYYARGMAFVDLAYLKKENIRGGKIVYCRRKTGQQLEVRLLPVMKQLLKRYRKTPGPYLFPILHSDRPSQKEYASALRLQNKRLKKLGRILGVKLSTYVARHSWASIALQKGISEDVISRGMGHTSVKTTRIYMAFLDNSQLDRANEIVISGRRIDNKGVLWRTLGKKSVSW